MLFVCLFQLFLHFLLKKLIYLFQANINIYIVIILLLLPNLMDDHIKNIPRKDKLHALEFDIDTPEHDISNDFINKIYKQRVVEKGLNISKKKKNVMINKNDNKYIMLLEFLNAILKQIGKDAIDDVLDFKNIPRDDILKEDVKGLLDVHLDQIIGIFGKKEIQYYNRKLIKDFIMSVIKSMAFECGYTLSKKKIEICKRNDPIRRCAMLYTIY